MDKASGFCRPLKKLDAKYRVSLLYMFHRICCKKLILCAQVVEHWTAALTVKTSYPSRS